MLKAASIPERGAGMDCPDAARMAGMPVEHFLLALAAAGEAAMPPGSSDDRAGAEGLKRLLESRDVVPTDYDDWRRIEQTETGRARPGSPREKFVRVEDWLKALGR